MDKESGPFDFFKRRNRTILSDEEILKRRVVAYDIIVFPIILELGGQAVNSIAAGAIFLRFSFYIFR
jgi:hypothetical protein